MGNTTVIGGYHILDFHNAKLTSSYQTISTIYDQLVKAEKRAIVIANVSNGNVPLKETFVDVRLSGSNFILYAHALKITITPTSKVKIEADEIHQRVDKIEETLTPEGLLENLIEGSDYISVDENEAGTKIKVELDETKVETAPIEDSDALITSGGVFDALAELPFRKISKDGDVKLLPSDRSGINFAAGQNVNIQSSRNASGDWTFTFNATGGSGSTDVFWANIGTTTAAEVEQALDEGKIVKFVYSGYEYSLAYTTSTYYYFTNATTSSVRQITLRRSDDTWSRAAVINIQKELTAGDGVEINASNVISSTRHLFEKKISFSFTYLTKSYDYNFSYYSANDTVVTSITAIMNDINSAADTLRMTEIGYSTDLQYLIVNVSLEKDVITSYFNGSARRVNIGDAIPLRIDQNSIDIQFIGLNQIY